jgi:hypothetical protein
VGELSTKALRVDECAELEPLYFDLFPVAAALEQRWQEDLQARGYEPNLVRPNSSFVVIIRGRSGSGKTTLAARFLKYLRGCRAPDDSEWKPVEHSFRDVDVTREPLSRAEIEAGCQAIRGKLAAVAPQDWACVLVDNANLEAVGKVIDEFNEASHCTRVFVITGDDVELLNDDLTGFPVMLDEPYELDALDPDSAVAYAKFRISYFRHPDHSDTDLCDKMFPLLEAAVRRWSAHNPAAADNQNPLVARVLNKVLTRRIDALFQRFRKDDIRALPPPRLVTLALLERLLDEL